MNIKCPKSWTRVQPKDYSKYGATNVGNAKVVDVYLRNEENNLPVTICSYDGYADDSTLDELKVYHDNMIKEDKAVDGENSFMIIKNRKNVHLKKVLCYACVEKYNVEKKSSFVFQLYFVKENQLFSVQTKLLSVDENDYNKVYDEKAVREIFKAID